MKLWLWVVQVPMMTCLRFGDFLIVDSVFIKVRKKVYIYIYTNLPVSDIVTLPHPWSGNSQGQETFLAPSADSKPANMTQSAQTTIPPYQP